MGKNEEKIRELVSGIIDSDVSLYLVDLNIHANNEINIIMDKDCGLTIGECAQLSRILYKKIIGEALFENDDFQLEVSSPGIDSPLILKRQFANNKGRDLEITTKLDDSFICKLLETTDSYILVETKKGKGKKMIIEQMQVLYEDIKTAVVQISFK